MQVAVKTTDGRRYDRVVDPHATVFDLLCAVFGRQPPPTACLMARSRLLDSAELVANLRGADIFLVGPRPETTMPPQQQQQQQQQHHSPPPHGRRGSGGSQRSPPGTGVNFAPPAPQALQLRLAFSGTGAPPAAEVRMPHDATISDLYDALDRAGHHGARMVFGGAVLPRGGTQRLTSCGVRDLSTIHVALAATSGAGGGGASPAHHSAHHSASRHHQQQHESYNSHSSHGGSHSHSHESQQAPGSPAPAPVPAPASPAAAASAKMKVMDTMQTEMDGLVRTADDAAITEHTRKCVYEASMKLLLKLDALEDLAPEERARRKAMIVAAQQLQDRVLPGRQF